jgi:hypothetical protein
MLNKILKTIMILLFIFLVIVIFCWAKRVWIDDEIVPKKEKVSMFKSIRGGIILCQYTKLGAGRGYAGH